MSNEQVRVHQDSNKLTVTVNPKKLVPRKQIVQAVGPFIRACSRQQPGTSIRPDKLNTNSPTVTPPGSRKGSSCPLLSLPLELFFEIFDHATEPYKQDGWLIPEASEDSESDPMMLILKDYRIQRLKFFHISKAFRLVAVSRFGEPSKSFCLPNPRIDGMVLKLNTLPEKPRRDYPPRRMESTQHRMRLPQSHLIKPHTGPWTDILQRVHHLDIDIDYRPYYDRISWSIIFRYLSECLPNLRSLEITAQRNDKQLDYYLFACLYRGRLYRPHVFPRLESLKVSLKWSPSISYPIHR
ncbi:hypothetical protein F4818DRAFT_230585 [Hypoxylon cercidicola]|nr:hypothetical protein F4818DRAFT_230585 [Hypoxylon cercidicola]